MNIHEVPSTMTRIAITEPGGPDVLQPRTVPVPTPADDEVLVRVQAAGVNRPDVMQRMGQYPMPPGVDPTPGLEVAGEVVAVGRSVTAFAVGDQVMGLTEGGGYADYCVLRAGQTLHRPAGMDAITAAAIPETFFTVWANVFQLAGATKGDALLVHGGTSGIGSTALMLATEFGIDTCATDDGPDKCRAAESFGAGRIVDYRRDDFTEAVLEWTDGRGADIILDIVGGPYLDRNIRALAQGGRLLCIGFLGGEEAPEVNLLTIALKRAVVTGSTMRSRSAAEKATIAAQLADHLGPVWTAGRCHPRVHQVFPLAHAADAHRTMQSGRHIGKIVLSVGA